MARAYGTRPSELLDMADPWLAFCVDEALFVRHAVWVDEQRPGGRAFRPDGYEPPDNRALRTIPWGGSGDDPLAKGPRR